MTRQKMGVASSQLMLAQSFRCFENSRNAEVLLKLLNLEPPKGVERSEAVERLERLERIDPGGFVLVGIKPVLSR